MPDVADKDLYDETVTEQHLIFGTNKTDFSVPIKSRPKSSNFLLSGEWQGKLVYGVSEVPIPTIKVAERVILPSDGLHYVLPLKLTLYAKSENQERMKAWIKKSLPLIKEIFHKASIKVEYDDIVVKESPSMMVGWPMRLPMRLVTILD